jgi:hypothetical protein
MTDSKWRGREAWRGEDNRRTRWFRLALRPIIEKALSWQEPWIHDRVLEWMSGHADRYVQLEAYDEYRGKGYCYACWRLVPQADLLRGMHAALADISLALEREQYPTLDEWLAALARGGERVADGPAERSAANLVRDRAAFWATRRMIKAMGKASRTTAAACRRVCVCCGGELMPVQRWPMLKYCESCRTKESQDAVRWGRFFLRTLAGNRGFGSGRPGKPRLDHDALARASGYEVRSLLGGPDLRIPTSDEVSGLAPALGVDPPLLIRLGYLPVARWPEEHQAAMVNLLRALDLWEDDAAADDPAGAEAKSEEANP